MWSPHKPAISFPGSTECGNNKFGLTGMGHKSQKASARFKVLGKLTQAGPIPQAIWTTLVAGDLQIEDPGGALLCELLRLCSNESPGAH